MTLHELTYICNPETTLFDRITALSFIAELDELAQNIFANVSAMLPDFQIATGFWLCGLSRALVCDVRGLSDGELDAIQDAVEQRLRSVDDPICRDELRASLQTITDEIARRYTCPNCGKDARWGEHFILIPAVRYGDHPEPADVFCSGEDEYGWEN